MKKILLATSVAITLNLSISHADQFRVYNGGNAPCSPCSSQSYKPVPNGFERDAGNLFIHRLNIAPRYYGCGAVGSNLHSIKNAAHSARKIDLLGKIEYSYGNSRLGYEAKHDIERLILRSGLRCSPNSLIVVMGYADKSGSSEANFHLSAKRARLVEQHIGRIGWQHGLTIQTAHIAMGEEVELRNHGLRHNRVAEIWLVEFPQPVNHVIRMVEPVVEQRTVMSAPISQTFSQSRILQPPATVQQVPGFAPQAPPTFSQPTSPAPSMLQQPQFNVPAPQNPGGFSPSNPQETQMIPVPQQAPQMMNPPSEPSPAPQMMTPPAEQMIAPPSGQMINPPAGQIQAQTGMINSGPINRPSPGGVQDSTPVEQTQVMQMPPAGNLLQGLADFLENNVTLSDEADRNEFLNKLNALKGMVIDSE